MKVKCSKCGMMREWSDEACEWCGGEIKTDADGKELQND